MSFLKSSLISLLLLSSGNAFASAHEKKANSVLDLRVHHVMVSDEGQHESGLELEKQSSILRKNAEVGLSFDILEESGAHEYHVGVHVGIDCVHYQLNFLADVSSDFFAHSELETEVDLVKHIHISAGTEIVPSLMLRYLDRELSPGVQVSVSRHF